MSPLVGDLDAIFGPLLHGMVARHVAAARARAIRDRLLTPAELEAMRVHGVPLELEDDPPALP